MTLEDQHGVIHMLAISPVEETELLLAVGGIVGGVEIEQDLAALANLLAAQSDELLPQPVVQAYQLACGRRVLPTAEGGLGSERVAQLLIGDDLQHGIVAQTIGVVGILVAGNDLIDALPQQRQRVMTHAVILTRIAQACSPVAGQTMVLIEGTQGQQTGITGDLATRKIGADGLMTVEGEGQLW